MGIARDVCLDVQRGQVILLRDGPFPGVQQVQQRATVFATRNGHRYPVAIGDHVELADGFVDVF